MKRRFLAFFFSFLSFLRCFSDLALRSDFAPLGWRSTTPASTRISEAEADLRFGGFLALGADLGERVLDMRAGLEGWVGRPEVRHPTGWWPQPEA